MINTEQVGHAVHVLGGVSKVVTPRIVEGPKLAPAAKLGLHIYNPKGLIIDLADIGVHLDVKA